jgi:hypothetical protein
MIGRNRIGETVTDGTRLNQTGLERDMIGRDKRGRTRLNWVRSDGTGLDGPDWMRQYSIKQGIVLDGT